MNTIDPAYKSLFTPSGCLTAISLEAAVNGSLSSEELSLVENHLKECELCSDAFEGVKNWYSAPSTNSGSKILRNRSSQEDHYADRVKKINNRILGRVIVHKETEAVRKTRKMPSPYRWVALAASIVLFLGVYYMVRLRPVSDKNKLAVHQEKEKELTNDSIPFNNKETLLPSAPSPMQAPNGKVEKNIPLVVESINNDVSVEMFEDIEVPSQNELSAKEPVVQKAPDQPLILDETATVKNQSINREENSKLQKQVVEEVEAETDVYILVEEMPEFPGGQKALLEFLNRNIQYPANARESGIQGVVYASFIVEANGKISKPEILRGIGGGCDEEALRVIKMMPDWIPAKQRGKVVPVKFNLPVSFKLTR